MQRSESTMATLFMCVAGGFAPCAIVGQVSAPDTSAVLTAPTSVDSATAEAASPLVFTPTPVTVAAGVPLRLRITRTAALHQGTAVEAILQQPVYVYDRVALSTGTVLHGVVSGTEPASRMDRTKAWLNGDITPQRTPVVLFDHMDGDTGSLPMQAEARIRTTQWVRFVPGKKQSLWQTGRTMVCERVESARASIFDPGKKDRALQMFYGQLPYHPQRIWAGTEMIADLQTASVLSLSPSAPTTLATANLAQLDGLRVRARLTDSVNSNTAKKDDPVTAMVTEPVFDAKGGLILPEGSAMQGHVLQSKPSRSFGRNGQLHFVFQNVKREGEEAERAHGVLLGASGVMGENLTVDQEGTVKAQADKNRFLAPLLLGALAVAGQDHDRDGGGGGNNGGLGRQTVAANGFGLIARVLALTVRDANMSAGFGYFATAKSIAFRFLAPGHPIDFAKDTMVEVQLQAR